MIKKINIFLVLLLLLLSIGAVSAAEDIDSTVMGSDDSISDIVASASDESLSADVTGEELLTSNTFTVDSSNYAYYFNSKGDLISTSVKAGDTIELDGTFSGKNFTFKKQINIVGTSTNHIKNGVITFSSGASGSTASNLKFTNTKDYHYGIFINGASNCTVQGCIINNTGQSSYGICVANNATYNNVTDNVITTYGKTYGHLTRSTPPLLLSGAHYNYIANNYIECDDANGIYLSNYQGGPLQGGVSTFNTIHNNTVKYNVLPTSWAYGIQVMGGYNTISANTIIGAYRGISTSEHGNVIVDNWIVNLTGADYNNPGVPSGGEIAIVASHDSIVRNNHIINSRIMSSGAGISVLDNSVVENNYLEILLQGFGIHPQGNNILINNNTIITNSGSGIFYSGQSYNLEVLNNTITSDSGVGVLIKKLSNSKMPGNITIVGNNISTSNRYAIDAGEADANTTNVIGPNIIKKGCEVITPEGSYDPSKPAYNFNGTVHNITPSNVQDYIDANGRLTSLVKDGDILNFTGEFYGGIIYVTSAIKITGDNPVFYNTTFRLSCDGAWLENLTIRNKKAERLNAWGVVAYKIAGATITNCDIYVDDPNAAYAIYVVEASDVDVINNTLSSSGDYLTYTLLGYAVEDCKFINNTINTLGTGVVHVFEGKHCLDGDTNCLDGDTNCLDGDTNCLDGDTNCLDGDTNCLDGDTNCLDGDTNCLDGSSIGSGNHVLTEVYRTYGILMAYSSGNNVTGNKVYATSKLNETVSPYNSTNSIVGIDLYFNSHDNNFTDNEVYINAKDNYIYGMGVLGYTTGHDAPEGQGALNNRFINNYIVINGTYCTEGIIIGHESKDTIIDNNIIKLNSMVSYGITLETSQQSTITDNYMELNSDVIYGVEAFSSSNNIMNKNEFRLNGKQVYGILLSNANNNSLIENIIKSNGTGENITFNNFDSVAAGNTGVFLRSNSKDNIIKKNTITSQTGYAILVDDGATGNVITDNYLDSEKGVGNDAVNNTQNNVVEDNYKFYFDTPTWSKGMYDVGYLGTLSVSLTKLTDGTLVKFYIGDIEIGSAIASNGKVTLDYRLNESFPAKTLTYKINAVLSKYNYQTKEFTKSLRVNKVTPVIELGDVYARNLNNGTFIAAVTDSSGNPYAGMNVKFYRYDGRDVFIGEAVTDDYGFAKMIAQISVTNNTYEIKAKTDGNSNFNAASGSATLNIVNIDVDFSDVTVQVFDNANFTVSVTNSSGNPVSGLNVKFYMHDGSDVLIGKTTTNSQGIAKLSYDTSSLDAGRYVIFAEVSSNDNSTFAGQQSILTLNKNDLNMIFTDASAYVLDNATLVAAISDESGNGISGLGVDFYMLQDGNYVNIGEATTNTYGIANVDADVSSLPLGSYEIFANFTGNGKFNPVGQQATLEITKMATNIDASDVTTSYDSGDKIVATLKDVKGNPIGDVNVKITAGSIAKTLKTDANGQVSLDISTLTPGSYTATIFSATTDIYERATTTASVVVNKLDTVLDVPDVVALEGSGSIVATLSDVYGNAVSGVNIKITVGSLAKTLKSGADGKVALDISSLAPGEYNVDVKTATTDIYNRATATATANVVSKFSTTLTVPDVNVVYNSGDKIVATLSDDYGNAVSGVNVKITVGSIAKTLKTDANGQVSLDISTLTPGSYTASVKSATTDVYERATATANVVVNKIDTVLDVPDVVTLAGSGSIVATFSDIYGNAISGVNVKITVGSLAKTLKSGADGKVALDISSLAPGEYNVDVKTATTDIYNRATATAFAVVSDGKVDTVLDVPNVATVTGSGSIVATFKDIYGNAISGVNVKITVGSLAKTLKSGADGKVALDISSLAPGEYNVDVKTATTDLYNRATATARAIVSEDKIDTVLDVPDVISVDDATAKVVATFKDVYGNVISGVNVKITVGSLAKTIKTDENGQAILDISSLAPGKYNVAVKTATTDIYNRATATASAIISDGKIDTVLTVPDVTTTHNSGKKISATFKDIYGNVIRGVNVKITVGSIAKTLKTDANGQVALDVSTLALGSYTASVKTATTDIYNRATATAKVTIN